MPVNTKYFGARASEYDDTRKHNSVAIEDDLAIAAFLALLPPSSIIADVPCGTGRAVAAVLAAGHRYRGADISEDMLAECRQKLPYGADATLTQADARKLPWADGECDHLLSIKFLKWLPTDEIVLEVLMEYRRVCQGKALVNVKLARERADYSLRELKDRCSKIIDRLKFGFSVRSMPFKTFETQCKRAGWTIVSATENTASHGIVHNLILD